MQDFLRITKALADESRVRALMALEGRELCACQLIELLALAPSTVSRHMALLRQAHLVETRKDGRWMYYRLPGQSAPAEVREALAWARRALAGSHRVAQDARRLAEILEIDREELCSRQGKAASGQPAAAEVSP